MNKRKFLWWWRLYTLAAIVYLLAGQTYWRIKKNQITQELPTKIVVPSSRFTGKNLLETHFQEVEADASFEQCGSDGNSWPRSTVELRFDSGYIITYPQLALSACPVTASIKPGPDHFRSRLTFWQGNLLIINYDLNKKRAVYPINHNPYVGLNVPQDVFAFCLLQVVACMMYFSLKARAARKGQHWQ